MMVKADILRGLIEDYAWAMRSLGQGEGLHEEEEVRQAYHKLTEYLKEVGL